MQNSVDSKIYLSNYLKIDKNNNKYFIGFFKNSISYNGITINTMPSIAANTFDNALGVYLIKIDSLGNFKMFKKLAESDSIFAISMDIKGDNSILISYQYNARLYLGQDTINNINGRTNINYINYDADGNIISKKRYDGYAEISRNSINADINGSVYIGGSFGNANSNANSLIIGMDTLFGEKVNIFIAKQNSSGIPIWAKSYGGLFNEDLLAFSESDGNLYLIGYLPSSNNVFGGITVNYPGNYDDTYFLAKLDTNGNALWVRKFGTQYTTGNLATSGIGSLVVKNNRIYFVGAGFSNIANKFIFDGGPMLTGTSSSNKDYFMACYDTAGNFIWNTISQSAGSEYISQLAIDSASNVYGIGGFDYKLPFPTDTLFTHGSDDVFVCSYDSLGNCRWAISGGGNGIETGNGIALDAQGVPWVVGGTTSGMCFLGNDTVFTNLQSTMWSAKIDTITNLQIPNAVNELQKNIPLISLAPNPAQNSTTLNILTDIYSTQDANISVVNTFGQMVYQCWLPKGKSPSLSLNTSNWASGLYHVSYRNKHFTQTLKLTITH